MLAAESPPLSVTFEIGPLTSLVRWLYWMTPLPVLNVMNRRGSLMKFTPALKSWPRPPFPAMCQEKSSRNWYFFCAVRLRRVGVLAGGDAVGERLVRRLAVRRDVVVEVRVLEDELVQLASPPATQLWFTLIELNLFLLSPQLSGVASGVAP